MGDALRAIQEVAARRVLGALVGSLHKCLKPRNVVWMSEVDDIDGDVVLLESSSDVLVVLLGAVQRMANEYNNSLPLRLVLPVLEGELSYLDGFQAVRVSIYKQSMLSEWVYVSVLTDLNVTNAVDEVTYLVSLRQVQLDPKNNKHSITCADNT